MKFKKILVTGGCGFIGSNFLEIFLKKYNKISFLNIDNLTYASNKKQHHKFSQFKNYKFKKVDICNFNKINKEIKNFKPEIIFHFAAESHVDNSILDPDKFIKTNIFGTLNILKAINQKTKFVHISTDEVYGHVENNKGFSEKTKYNPRSPYSVSKASSDFFVKAWANTYGLNYLILNCCNNFGPYQHKEKFIPIIVNSILKKKKIPLYGSGKQKREWIYVEDFVNAIEFLVKKNIRNQTFVIGSKYRETNLNLIKKIKSIMQKKFNIQTLENIFIKVKDRPGHDFEYKINSAKINRLGWKTKTNLSIGLENTIKFYLKEK